MSVIKFKAMNALAIVTLKTRRDIRLIKIMRCTTEKRYYLVFILSAGDILKNDVNEKVADNHVEIVR